MAPAAAQRGLLAPGAGSRDRPTAVHITYKSRTRESAWTLSFKKPCSIWRSLGMSKKSLFPRSLPISAELNVPLWHN